MAKELLRVSNQWIELVTPEAGSKYFFNSSGYPVKFILSDTAQDPESLDYSKLKPFTVGGSISQFHVSSKYTYAKAVVEDNNQVVVAVDSNKIDVLDQDQLRTDLDALTLAVMKLTNDTGLEQLAQLKLNSHFRLFIAQMLRTHTWISNMFSVYAQHTLKLHKRLFAAETYIAQHRKDWANLQIQIADLLEIDDLAGDLEDVQNKISQITAEVSGLTTRLNELVPRVEEAWADYDALVKEFINPLADQVDVLQQNFLSLNNTITKLTNEHTPEEIEEAFEEIIRHVNSEMVLPLTGLKNFLVELCIATQDNARQDIQIAGKVDYTDTVVVTPSSDMIASLAEDAANEDEETPEPDPEPPTTEPEEPETDGEDTDISDEDVSSAN